MENIFTLKNLSNLSNKQEDKENHYYNFLINKKCFEVCSNIDENKMNFVSCFDNCEIKLNLSKYIMKTLDYFI